MKLTTKEISFRIRAIRKRQELQIRFEAALHNKQIQNQAEPEQSEVDPEQERLMDQAMEAAILRKRMEARRVGPSNQNKR